MVPLNMYRLVRGMNFIPFQRSYECNHLRLCLSTFSGLRYKQPLHEYSKPEKSRGSFVFNLASRIVYRCKDKVHEFLGIKERMELSYTLYKKIDEINYKEFYSLFDMPDTFLSWFKVVELHIWMMLTLLMGDRGCDYKLRNELVKMMWTEAESRIRNLGPADRSAVKKQLTELSSMFPVTLLTYDEGILGSDMQLASALWYKFFSKHIQDPRKLEILVRYVRSQVHYMASLNIKDNKAAENIKVMWLPLSVSVKAVSDSMP